MADLVDIDNTTPADSLKAGATKLNLWRARIDDHNTRHESGGEDAISFDSLTDGTTYKLFLATERTSLTALVTALADITAAEADQIENIGTSTISAAQWGYLGACAAGGGQLLAALTTAESTQLEAIGTTTISATQWGYVGALDQGLTTTSTVTFATINAFTLGGKLTAGSVEIEGSNFDINGGTIDGITDLAIADGGTGSSTASDARTALGLAIGSNVQAYDADLTVIAGLAVTDSNFIVGNGSTWVAESGATARTSLGLGSVENTALSTWAGTTNITTLGTIATGTWNATVLGANYGGTGVANNVASTITITGAYTLGLTLTNTTSVTLPTSGTLISSVTTANGVSATNTAGALTFTLGVIAPTSVNALTLTAVAAGFTIAGGTTSKTLTVPLDASVSGTNTGDQTSSGIATLFTAANQAIDLGSGAFTTTGLSTLGLVTQKSIAANESATLGSELLSSSGWTSTDWTGDWATGWTHTTGNTTALLNTLAAVVDYYYQITYTVTNRTAGTFTITFGGLSLSSISATGAFGPRATSTGTLSITPTTDFNGTIVISIKQITANSTATYVIQDNTGTVNFAIRSSLNTLYNTFVGKEAGAKNTTGNQNVALGFQSLYSNTTGYRNIALGSYSLYYNTTGYENFALGSYSLYYNTTGYTNIAIGFQSLYYNTTSYRNIAIGSASLYNNTTGYNNLALGASSGRFIADGSTPNVTSNNSVYLGYLTEALASGDTNEIVIGASAIGIGSNSVVLGNDSILTTALKGNVGIGVTTFGTSAAKVLGLANATAPSTSPTDMIQAYSYDYAAGQACLHIRDELGAIIKLKQQAHIIDADGNLADITTKFNTLLSQLENQGMLATA